MSDKVRKLKERASRYSAKGKHEDALAEYKKAARLAPSDLSVRQKLAETNARLGKTHEAIMEYQSVAGSYAADGLLLKSIAICKVILNLDSSHTETQTTLANLYAKKRGDFGGGANAGAVKMPAAMSAALNAAKRKPNEIRGTPARSIGRKSVMTSVPPLAAAHPLTDENVIEIDADSGIEVLSVETASQVATTEDAFVLPPTAPIELATVTGTELIDDGDDSLDISIDEGELLDEDDEIFIDDSDSDDGEVLDLVEPVAVNPEELPPMPLFSDLSAEAFMAFTEKMGFETVNTGAVLIAEGEVGQSMFVVVQGAVKVVRAGSDGQEIKLAELGEGAFFGEGALLSDTPRTASVIATDDTMLFEISRDLLSDLFAEHAGVEQVMKRFHRNRLLTNLLRTSPLFAPFSAADKKSLIEKFKSRSVAQGRILITKDKQGDGLYVLLSGHCEVLTKTQDGREVTIAELREGDVFGEMALLFKDVATASVRAITPCIVLRLPRKNFDELIMTHPQVLETLSQISSKREAFNQELLGATPL